MEHMFTPDQLDKKGVARKPRPEDRLNRVVFDLLTYNSVPMTHIPEDGSDLMEEHKNGDVTMVSQGPLSPLQPGAFWDKYVHEMSPFYFNILSELLEAVGASQLEFGQEDVDVFKEIASVFKITRATVE